MHMFISIRRGFTLMELLVVILIIGVLAAVAVPQYKRATLKSRYSGLLPTAKAVAVGDEAYYLGNGYYARSMDELSVVPSAQGVQVALNDDPDQAYVRVSREGIPNTYVLFLQKSKNFAGNIFCEAENDNDLAQWLCEKSLNGQKFRRNLSDGYTTYVVEGKNSGLTPTEMRWDLNGDGALDGKDQQVILNYVLGTNPYGWAEQDLDVDGNGKVNVTDFYVFSDDVLNQTTW